MHSRIGAFQSIALTVTRQPLCGRQQRRAGAGVNTASINVHLPYEPVGVRPLLGEPANPYLSAAQQAVRPELAMPLLRRRASADHLLAMDYAGANYVEHCAGANMPSSMFLLYSRMTPA